jgi:hypothetical protein
MKEQLIDEWYVIQYSGKDTDDWFTWSEQYGKPEACLSRIAGWVGKDAWKGTEFRVVHVRQTETVVSP